MGQASSGDDPLENQEEQNPTPEQGGASTLDRLERYLAAQDEPDQPNPEAKPDEGAESDDATDGDGQQSNEPQLTTSDLAKFLGIDEAGLDLDEDGTVKLKTKVDGVEGAAKLQDLIKSYQLQEHVDKKSREAAEREKALQTREQEAQAQFAQRIQYAEGLANVAAQQLMAEFQSIDWNALEQQDAGTAALWRQKFQERQAQLRGVYHNIQQERAQAEQKTSHTRQEKYAREVERLIQLLPEWQNQETYIKESSEIQELAKKRGVSQEALDSITKGEHFDAGLILLIRDALLHSKLQASKSEIENRVRKAPVLVKPGQPAQDAQAQQVQNLKHAVRKSGGKGGSVAAYLLATGKV